MFFKWNKEDKSTGIVEVKYGYHGNRKVIGVVNKTAGVYSSVLDHDANVILKAKSVKGLKGLIQDSWSTYQNEMVPRVNPFNNNKIVMVPRGIVGTSSDPTTEAYHCM